MKKKVVVVIDRTLHVNVSIIKCTLAREAREVACGVNKEYFLFSFSSFICSYMYVYTIITSIHLFIVVIKRV
jgi:hypothetical protein